MSSFLDKEVFAVDPMGMEPELEERLQILRRIAERGLRLSQQRGPEFVDLFQHMLDELQRMFHVEPKKGPLPENFFEEYVEEFPEEESESSQIAKRECHRHQPCPPCLATWGGPAECWVENGFWCHRGIEE